METKEKELELSNISMEVVMSTADYDLSCFVAEYFNCRARWLHHRKQSPRSVEPAATYEFAMREMARSMRARLGALGVEASPKESVLEAVQAPVVAKRDIVRRFFELPYRKQVATVVALGFPLASYTDPQLDVAQNEFALYVRGNNLVERLLEEITAQELKH